MGHKFAGFPLLGRKSGLLGAARDLVILLYKTTLGKEQKPKYRKKRKITVFYHP
jgi:hypothetical protein